MTREEAIETLKTVDRIWITDKEAEALDMAIQALSQEPTSPCDLCRYDYIDDYCGECPAMAKGEWE